MARGIKKDKVPGDVITMKTRLNEHPLVMEWINKQSNQGDSIRYLIEQDIIRRGGVCNLQFLIPTVRNLDELMTHSEGAEKTVDPPLPEYRAPVSTQTVEEKKPDWIQPEPPAQIQESKAAKIEEAKNAMKPAGKVEKVDEDSTDITEEDIGSWA